MLSCWPILAAFGVGAVIAVAILFVAAALVKPRLTW